MEIKNSPFVELDGMRVIEFRSQTDKPIVVDNFNGRAAVVTYADQTKQAYKDDAKFIKIYHNNIDLCKLSAAALHVFSYLINHLGICKEEIVLVPEYINEWTGIKSKASPYAGIKDLISKGVISLKNKRMHEYYINPNVVFNGSRKKILGTEIRKAFADKLNAEHVSNKVK